MVRVPRTVASGSSGFTISCEQHQDEVRDRHRGEQPERGAPRRARRPPRARPGGQRDHQPRDQRAGDEHDRHVRGQERQPQVPAGQDGAAVERDVVGEERDAHHDRDGQARDHRPEHRAAGRAGTGASGPRTSRDGGPPAAGRGSADGPVIAAQDRQRPARRDGLGRVARPAARRRRRTGPARPRSSRSPTEIRSASIIGRSRRIANVRVPSSSTAPARRPARDPERDQGRHRSTRRDQRDARDRGEPVGRPGRQPGRALVGPRQPDVHRQPAAAAREPDDRRAVEAGRLEPAGARDGAPARSRSNVSNERNAACAGSRRRRRARGAPTARPCPRARAATSGRAARTRRRRAPSTGPGSRRPPAPRR